MRIIGAGSQEGNSMYYIISLRMVCEGLLIAQVKKIPARTTGL